ncbi:hypothetical protein BGW38_005946, partial [Lunasporangiospora selenospora]
GHAPDEDKDLEDMMTDSAIACTPPLDLASDSGDDLDDDDDEPVMQVTSSFPPALASKPIMSDSFQLLSILNARKRKDSQEHVLIMASPNVGRDQAGQTQSKQGQRPTVSSGVALTDTVDGASPLCTDHGDDRIVVEDDGKRADKIELMATTATTTTNKDYSRLVQTAEQALCRVSISLGDTPDSVQEDDGEEEMKHGLVPQDKDNSTRSAPDNAANAPESSTTRPPLQQQQQQQNKPKDIILNHIMTEYAPQDMLVALFDRSTELEALAAKNSDFFQLVYGSVSAASRNQFKSILYMSRADLGDQNWMNAIAAHLATSPCVLEKLKNIVGWIGPDSLGSDDSDYDDRYWDGDEEDEYCCRNSSFEEVQIKWLRDVPDFCINGFQASYPQFFLNAQERLQGRRLTFGGDRRDLYVIFCETLQLTREQFTCDNAWARRMHSCLEKHPELVLQLKEIIAYEVGYDC